MNKILTFLIVCLIILITFKSINAAKNNANKLSKNDFIFINNSNYDIILKKIIFFNKENKKIILNNKFIKNKTNTKQQNILKTTLPDSFFINFISIAENSNYKKAPNIFNFKAGINFAKNDNVFVLDSLFSIKGFFSNNANSFIAKIA